MKCIPFQDTVKPRTAVLTVTKLRVHNSNEIFEYLSILKCSDNAVS